METRIGKSKSFLAGAKGAEVLRCSGNNIGAEFHDDATSWSTTNCHVKKTFWVCHDVDLERI